MKRFLVVPFAVAAGLVVSGVVGGASAQAPGLDSVTKSITILGAGYGGQVPAKSTVASRRNEYKAALEDAMDDARTKAIVVAEKSNLSLGAVNEVTEDTSAGTCGAPKTKTTCSMRANVTVNFAVS